jgi:hypothetical protein
MSTTRGKPGKRVQKNGKVSATHGAERTCTATRPNHRRQYWVKSFSACDDRLQERVNNL